MGTKDNVQAVQRFDCDQLKRQDLATSWEKLTYSLMLGKIEGGRRRGRQRMRWLDGITYSMDEFEQAPGVGDGQGGLACCSPWDHKESDTTERLN